MPFNDLGFLHPEAQLGWQELPSPTLWKALSVPGVASRGVSMPFSAGFGAETVFWGFKLFSLVGSAVTLDAINQNTLLDHLARMTGGIIEQWL